MTFQQFLLNEHPTFTLVFFLILIPVVIIAFIIACLHHSSKKNDSILPDKQNDNSTGSLPAYATGFILSLVLSIIPFIIIAWKIMATKFLFIALAEFALLQFFVQSVFFLQLNTGAKCRSNLVAYLFTILVVFILVSGTLWIMFNLNYNMMVN
jgi:cytochrome o ubiquinol oxidase operon protein cyoD